MNRELPELTLVQALLEVGNHHLGLAMKGDLEKALKEYGNRLDKAMSDKAFLPYFGECRKRVIKLMDQHKGEEAVDLTVSIIGKISHFDCPMFAELPTTSSLPKSNTPQPIPHSPAAEVKSKLSIPKLARRKPQSDVE